MLKKDWKKNLLRVKQLADQGLGRAEKSEVLSEELLSLERRVEIIRQVCHSTHKKVTMCLQTAGIDKEKRLRKMPDSQLAASMLESAELLGIETLLGQMFQLCGNAINTVANDLLQYELNVEGNVLMPIQTLLDNDIPVIVKQRKHLNKFTIDMDVARSRYQSVVKQNHAGNASAAKTDSMRDEMEDTAHRVEQCRDQLSTDMYAFLARESEYSGMLLEMIKANISYHQRSLDVLERLVPQMEEQIVHSTNSPVYGVSLEEHLRRTNRDISVVLEDCVVTLLEVGMEEEGLFRVAGSSSKVKKLKAAFDFGMVDMSEHVRDIHCVAGALKLYLRELPEPLMTYSLYSEWMHAARMPQVDQRLPALWQVLSKLPKQNYNNLRYLIKFLAKLAEKEDVNKMSPSNIAIVIGPNLIWAPGDGGPNVLNTSIQSAVIELFVTYADYFFEEDVDFNVTSASSSQGSPVSLATNGSGTAQAQVTADYVQPALVSPLQSPPVSALLVKTTPPGSLSTSQDNLLQAGSSPSESPVGGVSPRAPRRLTKKPAPLPPPGVGAAPGPVIPEKPIIAERPALVEKPPYAQSVSTLSSSSSTSSDSPQVTVSPPADKSGATSPLVERPMVPPPAPPCRPEKPNILEKPSSPLPERPRGPPPERPSMPPPEKPDRPPSFPLPEKSEKPERPEKPDKPEKPEKPAKPAGMMPDGYGSLTRPGSMRPPRPQPPPPPPPERRSSSEKAVDKQAPLAVAEEDGIGYGSPEASPKTVTEETHL